MRPVATRVAPGSGVSPTTAACGVFELLDVLVEQPDAVSKDGRASACVDISATFFNVTFLIMFVSYKLY